MRIEPLTALVIFVLLFAGCVGKGTEGKPMPEKEIHPAANISSTTSTAADMTTTTSTTTAEPEKTETEEAASSTNSTTSSTSTSFAARRVEVVFFYPNSPCENCIEVGELAEQTIDTYYMQEVSEGKLVFIKANYFDPKNRELIKKYGPESSSLWIGTYDNGKFYKEMKIGVWYKTGNAKDYMEYLKGAIDARLQGGLPS